MRHLASLVILLTGAALCAAELEADRFDAIFNELAPKFVSRARRTTQYGELIESNFDFLPQSARDSLVAMRKDERSVEDITHQLVTFVLEHYESKGVTRSDFIKTCYAWIDDVTTAEEKKAFEMLHHTDHNACKLKVREFLTRLESAKRAEVEGQLPLCEAIWYHEHKEMHAGDHHAHHKHHVRRHANDDVDDYITWMTDDEKAQIKALKSDKDAMYSKIMNIWETSTGDKKKQGTEKLMEGCKMAGNELFGAEKAAELRKLKESGETKESMLKKVDDAIAGIEDAEKQAKAKKTVAACTKVYNAAAVSRRRRDGDHGQYVSWLEEADLKEFQETKKTNEGAAYDKIIKIWEGLTGDKKTEATMKLKEGCKHFFKHVFGDAKVEEFKKLKESGASVEAMSVKLNEEIAGLTDEAAKAKASGAAVGCKKVFEAASASRKRRDHHHGHSHQEYISWLSDDEKAEVLALKENKEEMYSKIMKLWEQSSGEKKTEGTAKLIGGCKHFIKETLGEAKAEELKKLKEGGASIDEMETKIKTLVDDLTDADKKAQAEKALPACKKVFQAAAAASRRRRDGDHGQYVSWLEEADLKEFQETKKTNEGAAYDKIIKIWEGLTGDKKTEATMKLKEGCKHFFKHVFGDAKVEEFKKLKESGASVEAMSVKLNEEIAGLTDEAAKARASGAAVGCKKVFEAASASRRRRHQDQHQHAEYISWLSDDEKAEVLALKDNREKMYAKVMELWSKTSGDKKTEATGKLKEGCKHFFAHVFGDDKAEEVKKMKEAGDSLEKIGEAITTMIGEITDAEKKGQAEKLTGACKQIFHEGAPRMIRATRRREDYDDDDEY